MDGTERTRGQLAAIAVVCLLSGLVVGFVVMAVASGGDGDGDGDRRGGRAGGDTTGRDRTVAWQRVMSSTGRYSVELPGEPVEDAGSIALGVDRAVPVVTRHVTTSDGTTATIAELDYSSVLDGEPYDLRLGAANAVGRAGGSMDRYEAVASPLGPAASFGGSGDGVEVHGFLVADGDQVVLLLVRGREGSAAVAEHIVRMAASLERA